MMNDAVCAAGNQLPHSLHVNFFSKLFSENQARRSLIKKIDLKVL